MHLLAKKLATLRDAKYKYNISKHYFHPQRNTGVTYGELYPSSDLLWTILPEAQYFDPFSICNSCQLIIVKAPRL